MEECAGSGSQQTTFGNAQRPKSAYRKQERNLWETFCGVDHLQPSTVLDEILKIAVPLGMQIKLGTC